MSWQLVEEGKFFRILKYRASKVWWVVEDKLIKLNFPDSKKGRSQLSQGLWAETVFDESKNAIEILRLWFDGDIYPESVIRDYAYRIERTRLKEYEKLKKYKALEQLAESGKSEAPPTTSPP